MKPPAHGFQIRDRRKALGLTQTDIGDAIGVEQQTISRYEAGAIVPIPKWGALVAALQLDDAAQAEFAQLQTAAALARVAA